MRRIVPKICPDAAGAQGYSIEEQQLSWLAALARHYYCRTATRRRGGRHPGLQEAVEAFISGMEKPSRCTTTAENPAGCQDRWREEAVVIKQSIRAALLRSPASVVGIIVHARDALAVMTACGA